MPLLRHFDHDEARRLRAAGWTYKALAARYGVTDGAVRYQCDPAVRARMDARVYQILRDGRTQCRGGCGKLVWTYARPERTGYCIACLAAKRRAETKVQHGTEVRYRNYGCRCDLCRDASAEARRRRREAAA
jgi:hypothetical protein